MKVKIFTALKERTLAVKPKMCLCLIVLMIGFFSVNANSQQTSFSDFNVVRLLEKEAILGLFQTKRAVIELTLNDAIERALNQNLDIAIERLRPQLHDLTFAQQSAVYRPTLSVNLNSSSRTTPSSTQLDGGQSVNTDTSVFDSSLDQRVKWGGGNLSLSWNNNRTDTTNFFSSFNPSYRSDFSASYTQPLLRGLRIDNNRQQLKVTKINREISEVNLRQTIANTLADVRTSYWELVYAIRAVDVQQQALDLARQLVRDNRARVEIGTLAPIDVIQAQSEEAARQQSLAQAEQNLQTSELTLKRLLVSGTQDELWAAEVKPIDQPAIIVEPVDVQTVVRAALAERTDLSRARHQKEINSINVRTLKNNTLPALDLIGNYQLQGQGGVKYLRQGLGGNIQSVIPGSFNDALSQIAKANFPTWTVRLQLSYPIGRSSDEAALERANLQVRQNETELKQLELQIVTEVTNAALQINIIKRRIEAATAARILAEEQLAAEENKLDVGTSTNFFVVQSQRDLATAQDTELRALLDYQKAVIELERVQQTSLSQSGISIVGGGQP